jgi:hypothetical protein
MRWAPPEPRAPVEWGASVERMLVLLDQDDSNVATLVRLGGARTMTATARDVPGAWPHEVVLSDADGHRLALIDLTTAGGDGDAFYHAWRALGGRWLWLPRDVRTLHFHEAWPFDPGRVEEG